MKTTIQTLSLSSLLIALAATVGATAGVPLPSPLSAEALLGAFTAVGTALVMVADYSRNRRALPGANTRRSGAATLFPAPEAFARPLSPMVPYAAAGDSRQA